MIDWNTLNEWDAETNVRRCESEKFAARVSMLIQEVLGLREREAAFRLSLKEISRYGDEKLSGMSGDSVEKQIADRVLQRYPEEKE